MRFRRVRYHTPTVRLSTLERVDTPLPEAGDHSGRPAFICLVEIYPPLIRIKTACKML